MIGPDGIYDGAQGYTDTFGIAVADEEGGMLRLASLSAYATCETAVEQARTMLGDNPKAVIYIIETKRLIFMAPAPEVP
jgi:hypothetical protein